MWNHIVSLASSFSSTTAKLSKTEQFTGLLVIVQKHMAISWCLSSILTIVQKWLYLAGHSSGVLKNRSSRLTTVACIDFWACIDFQPVSVFVGQTCCMPLSLITTPTMQSEAPAWLWLAVSLTAMACSFTWLMKDLVLALAGPLRWYHGHNPAMVFDVGVCLTMATTPCNEMDH